MAELAIGTVQFGLDYGIQGDKKVEDSAVIEILKTAAENNIFMLDTAAAYGNSERVLGSAIPETSVEFNIVTKLIEPSVGLVKKQLLESLNRLSTDHIFACMFHDFQTVKNNISLFKELEECRNSNMIEKAGISLYYPEEWIYLQKKGISPDIIQIPYNLFDRRFEELLPEIKSIGTEIHVRSIFLQGLFFMNPEDLNEYFQPLLCSLSALKDLSRQENISIPELVFRFVASNNFIDYMLVGITSSKELLEDIKLSKLSPLSLDLKFQLDEIKIEDDEIIMPFNWPKNKGKQ